MTPALRQQKQTTTSMVTSHAVSFDVLPVRGSQIVVAVLYGDSDELATPGSSHTMTDNQGNTYTRRSNETTAFSRIELWEGRVNNSSGTFTVTVSDPEGYLQATVLLEWTGIRTDPFDVSDTGTGASTSLTTGTSAATAQDVELVVAQAFILANGENPPVPQAPYTSIATNAGGSGRANVSYLVTSVAGTQEATWTAAALNNYAAQLITLRAAPESGSPETFGLVSVG